MKKIVLHPWQWFPCILRPSSWQSNWQSLYTSSRAGSTLMLKSVVYDFKMLKCRCCSLTMSSLTNFEMQITVYKQGVRNRKAQLLNQTLFDVDELVPLLSKKESWFDCKTGSSWEKLKHFGDFSDPDLVCKKTMIFYTICIHRNEKVVAPLCGWIGCNSYKRLSSVVIEYMQYNIDNEMWQLCGCPRKYM